MVVGLRGDVLRVAIIQARNRISNLLLNWLYYKYMSWNHTLLLSLATLEVYYLHPQIVARFAAEIFELIT
jgi:hypothetical protein